MIISKRQFVAVVLAVLLISSPMFYLAGKAASPSSTFTIDSGQHAGAPSYTVYYDGTEYCAKDQNGLNEFTGASAATVIQDALDGLTVGRTWQEKVLLKGSFVAYNIQVPDNTEIELEGTIQLPASLGSSQVIFTGEDSTPYNIHIHGGTLDGNLANNPTYGKALIFNNLKYSIIENIVIQNFRERSCYFYASVESEGLCIRDLQLLELASTGIYLSGIKDSYVTGINGEGLNGTGIEIGACIESTFSGNAISAEGAGAYGYYIHDPVWGCMFIGNDADYCGSHGFFLNGLTHNNPNTFIGNYAGLNGGDGFHIKTVERCLFKGNIAYGNDVNGFSLENANTYDNLFEGNIAVDKQVSPTQDYGVYEATGVHDNRYINNELTPNGIGGIYSVDGNYIAKNNKGFVTENSGSALNVTATTFSFNHGLAAQPNYAWASFNTTAVEGYTWTANATAIDITVTGTSLPASITTYWRAEYEP